MHAAHEVSVQCTLYAVALWGGLAVPSENMKWEISVYSVCLLN